VRSRLAAEPKLVNRRAKPPDSDALPPALRVIAAAKEVSHPDKGHAGVKYDTIRQRLGLNPSESLADYIRSLNARLGMPATLAEMGVPGESFPAIAKSATEDHSSATNPRPASADDYQAILQSAYAGESLRRST